MRLSPFAGTVSQFAELLHFGLPVPPPPLHVHVVAAPHAENAPATIDIATALASQRCSVRAAILVANGVGMEVGFIVLAGAETTLRGWVAGSSREQGVAEIMASGTAAIFIAVGAVRRCLDAYSTRDSSKCGG